MADLCQRYVRISIHALLAESDIQQLGGQTGIFISIHALLAESDGTQLTVADVYKISIHALLAESDLYDTYAKVLRVNISIHALLAESDRKVPLLGIK